MIPPPNADAPSLGKRPAVESEHAGSLQDKAALYLYLAALLTSLFVFANWINIPITDQHAYRQTQTALSTFWLAQNGHWLTPQLYETPIVGFPWRNPLEFPVYQWLVAALKVTTGMPLEVAGRLVSITAFYGCLGGIHQLVKDGGGSRRLFHLIAATLLLSPEYLFWSRTFMIESTALFLTISYLALLHRFLVRKTWGCLVVAILCGVLGVLTKVTTFPSFAVASLMLIALHQLQSQNFPHQRHWLRVTLPALLSLGICFVAIQWWVHYCDEVKSQTVFGKYLTSQAMSQWNYGEASLRFSSKLWVRTIWNRSVPEAVGGFLGVIVCLVGFWFANLRFRLLIGSLLGLFLLPFLLFTNLHVVHNYYQYSNAIFLVAALGVALHVLSQRLGQTLFIVVILTVATNQILWFKDVDSVSFEHSWRDRDLLIARYIKTQTQPGQVLVMFGSDGSSVIPYYAERRALTIPTQLTTGELDSALANIPQNAGNLPIGAVILNGVGLDQHAMEVNRLVKRIGAIRSFSRVERHGSYVVFFPRTDVAFPKL
ncbi:MAG: hypothetical protein ABIT76_06995 [Chthoniobacterales bacterium]